MQNTMIEIPLVWAGFAGFVLACVVIAKLPMSKYTGKTPPLATLQERFGLAGLNGGLFFLALLFWAVLFGLVFGGLILTIIEITRAPLPAINDTDAIWTWRFSVLKLASLTAVLGAVVALPFTILRLSLNRQEAETAKDSLLNDKINAAISDLYSQRQVTQSHQDSEKPTNVWEDDIVRRTGAIDRLEGLVETDPNLAPRITRMLSVYVQVLSSGPVPAEPVPENLQNIELRNWARNLQKKKRPDMERAVQTLGRLPIHSKEVANDVFPALANANLQGFDLSNLTFKKADFEGAQMQGATLNDANMRFAKLTRAQLQGAFFIKANLQGANLDEAHFGSAVVSRVQMQGASMMCTIFSGSSSLSNSNLRGASIQGMDLNFLTDEQAIKFVEDVFGDTFTKFRNKEALPDRFRSTFGNSDEEYQKAWRAFQRSISQDPDNPT